MTPGVRALLLALVVLVVGLEAVHVEIERVRSGVRLRRLLIEKEERVERLRRMETRFLTACSPDLLLKELPPDLPRDPEDSDQDGDEGDEEDDLVP